MPRQAVAAAACVLALAAAVGAALGVSHGVMQTNSKGEEAGQIVPAVTPVASAKPILAPLPSLDETDVRKLAREEAEAVLARSQKRAKALDEEEAASDAEELTPVAPPAQPLAPMGARPVTSGQPPS